MACSAGDDGDKVLGVPIKSEEEISELVGEKTLDTEQLSLFYNSYEAIYDKLSGTYLLAQSGETEDWSGQLTVQEGELFFQEEESIHDKAGAIADGERYTVYCIGENSYQTCEIVFTGMPVMSIEGVIRENEIQLLDYSTMELFDPYRETFYQTAEVYYALRGATTRFHDKPSYKLTLQETKEPLLGMRKDDDWVLLSLYDDAGLIHNKLSYEVWHELAENNAVQNDTGTNMEYVELILNGEYQGVYGLLERIDEKELDAQEQDILFKCNNWNLEMDASLEDYGLSSIFEMKYPDDYGTAEWDVVKEWVDTFCLYQEVNYEQAASLINMENAIDYNLFCLLCNATDNTRKNVYFLAEDTPDGYQIKKVPWDLNVTWGNVLNTAYTSYAPVFITSTHPWSTDIGTLYYLNEEEVTRMLYDRWQELREETLTIEELESYAQEQIDYLHNTGAYARNMARWTEGGASLEWQDAYLFEYIEQRIPYLDAYLEQLCEDSTTPEIYDGVDYSNEFNARAYYDLNSQRMWDNNLIYEEEALLEDYVLYGRPEGLMASYY